MHIANLDTVKLNWREEGDPAGMPVVFANSLGTDLRLWDKVVARLPAGLTVIRFDKRGHGLSSCPDAPYSMEQLVGDAATLLDMLGVRNCVFVGLSIGGMIGQGLAATRPDLIKALVLSNTAAKMGSPEMWEGRISAIETNGIASIADAILERWFAPEFRATDEFEAWRNMLTRTPQQGYVGCCRAIAAADLAASTAKLTLPTLGIAGSEDGSSPPDLVRGTVEMIQGSRFHVIDGTGHLPCVEKPDAYAALLTAFLKENA
ncbi:MAG: 3-oxoadipate enol-lactonase [Pseudomonadota bacterium]